jgi:hypothetical protein
MTLVRWWPFALLLGLFAAIGFALAECAVAEMVARFAAWCYTPDREERARKREEWLRVLDDMRPRERPGHAGSLLWVGLRRLPSRVLYRCMYRLGRGSALYDSLLIVRIVGLGAPVGPLCRLIWRMQVYVAPRLAWRTFSGLAGELAARHRESGSS